MADPVIKVCAADVWTKVATDVQDISIHSLSPGVIFAWSYRATGGAAPSGGTERVLLPRAGIALSSSTGVDVYIHALSAGSVRVDEGLIGTYLIDG